jgi:hypothetical protein
LDEKFPVASQRQPHFYYCKLNIWGFEPDAEEVFSREFNTTTRAALWNTKEAIAVRYGF